MEVKKYKLKYQGVNKILMDCPGYSGRVAPGDIIDVLESALTELSGHDEWAVVVEKKEDKKSKNGGDE